MKKIILLFSLIFSYSSVDALLFSWSRDEEYACFDILNEAVKNDNRYVDSDVMPDWDLSKVLFDEWNSSFVDFSNYYDFWYNASVNPVNTSNGNVYDDYLFYARRNNIGTIIAGNDYVLSQISWFWRDSNFDFPLESKTWQPFGDKYKMNGNFFKEYVVYTHHVRDNSEDYPLMSCWIVKVTPLWGRTFSDINESWYMTNILNGISPQAALWWNKCASWFEWEYVSESWEDFYKMKSNVCVQSYDESDYLKLEVISIAYDNDSERINEYYTHPLQVEAMRNNANHAQWLKWIQDTFRSKLENETCYRVIHWNKPNLPSRCNNKYGPISRNDANFSLLEYFIPSVFAESRTRENFNLDSSIDVGIPDEEDTGLMVYGNLPYKLYKKLENIPDESFREYMLLSVLPNFEELIKHREENDVLLTPFEETFLSCDLDYTERLNIVTRFLEDLDIDKFSLSNLQYSNEKYGDCIVPYPDKDKLLTVVEWSFESNQLLAQKLSWEYSPAPDSPEVEAYIKKREELLSELNKNLEDIQKRFNAWEIDINRANVLKIEEREKINALLAENDIVSPASNTGNVDEIIQSNVSKKENNNIVYIAIIVFTLIGLASIAFGIYRKNKK